MENKPIIISDSTALHEIDSKVELQNVLSKMIAAKSPFNYKKLVVPTSMRSIYWKYFGFPANDAGEILTKVKIVCLLCKTHIAYNRNTSNLRMHLQNKHTQELHELETMSPPRRQVLSQEAKEKRAQKRLLKAGLGATQHLYTTNADGTIQIDGDIQFVTEPNINLPGLEEDVNFGQPLKFMIKGEGNTSNSNGQNVAFVMQESNEVEYASADGKIVWNAIAECLIMDLQLPDIVEGRGFQRLVATLKTPCEIPSKNRLENEIIPKIYDSFRESVAANFACLNGDMGLAFEEWRSNIEESFVTTSVYYQNPEEPVLECKVLNTFHVPEDWEEAHWATTIDNIFIQWGLKVEKITAVILGSSRPALIAALASRGLAFIPCLLHTLQVCAQACFETPEVANVISKCRAVIGAIAGCPAGVEALTLQEQMLEISENALLMDYPAVWTSTYNMLEQMVLRRNILGTILENMDTIDRDSLDLTNEQWRIVEDLVMVLEPFKVTIMTLSEEKIPLISLLKPLLWQLVSSHLKAKEVDSDMARELKESLSEMLSERYSDFNITLLLQIATTLDPRFKELPYATDEDKNMVAASIKEMLTKLIQEESGEDNETKNEDEEPANKKRMSGMKILLGNLCSTKSGMPAEEKADLELVQYQSEATAPLDYCPLQWWLKVAAKCPILGKLARRYNCVPLCCAPPFRISAEAQILYDTKRAALPPHLVDKLLFLNGNHNTYRDTTVSLDV